MKKNSKFTCLMLAIMMVFAAIPVVAVDTVADHMGCCDGAVIAGGGYEEIVPFGPFCLFGHSPTGNIIDEWTQDGRCSRCNRIVGFWQARFQCTRALCSHTWVGAHPTLRPSCGCWPN